MLFSRDERLELEAAVTQAELHTASEIVVATVARSSEYSGFRAALAAAWTVALGLLVYSLLPTLAPPWILWAQLPVGLLLWFVCRSSALLRLLLPSALIESAVYRRALQLFAERGVHHTRDHSGLLILISEAEHRVIILGDRGIHERLGTSGWQVHVDAIVRGLKEKRAKDATVAVLQQLAAVLSVHFPKRADDTNELPNSVRVE